LVPYIFARERRACFRFASDYPSAKITADSAASRVALLFAKRASFRIDYILSFHACRTARRIIAAAPKAAFRSCETAFEISFVISEASSEISAGCV
jgi:hypothetical protein